MEKQENVPGNVIAALTAALHLYIEQETKAPPFIILPSELRASTSPWRFMGRKELMDNRSFVQMKMIRR